MNVIGCLVPTPLEHTHLHRETEGELNKYYFVILELIGLLTYKLFTTLLIIKCKHNVKQSLIVKWCQSSATSADGFNVVRHFMQFEPGTGIKAIKGLFSSCYEESVKTIHCFKFDLV